MHMFLLFIHSMCEISDFRLPTGRLLTSRKPQILESQDEGYYFVKIQSKKQIPYLKSLGIDISTADMMNQYWISAYMTTDQVQIIASNSTFYVSKVTNSDKYNGKLLSDDKSKFLIRGHPTLARNGIQRFSKHFFMSSEISASLISDPKVLAITKVPKPQLLNRYATGYHQESVVHSGYDGRVLGTDHPMFRYGLRGEGQIISVIDSGLDHRHCFFFDPNVRLPVNETNYNHRKIVRYDAYADAGDCYAGHGTHVCGSLAGSPTCEDCSIRSYSGQAPGAKLYFVDAGYPNEPGELGADYDFYDVMNMTEKLGGGIMSNSWGFPTDTEEIREMFDEVGYIWPNITIFFASGNSHKSFDTWVPANSKNMVGVAGVTKGEMPNMIGRVRSGDLHVTCGYASEKVQAVIQGDLSNKYQSDPVPNYIDQVLGEGMDIVKNAGTVTKPSVEFALTANSNLKYGNKVTLLVSQECIAKTEQIGRASLTVNASAEVNGPTYGIAQFASLGPSVTGLLKPDILGVGYIDSAFGMKPIDSPRGCTVRDGLTSKSGTSMAAPSVAGSAALLRQYFMDGYYPSGQATREDGITPSAALMRAVLANSGDRISDRKDTPTTRNGFGIIHTMNAAVFAAEERSKEYGLRVAEMQFTRGDLVASMNITTTNANHPLTISLAWIDPPTGYGSEDPIYADLDLIVTSPSGKIIYGNQNDNYEETHSTIERVKLVAPEIGTYMISVHVPSFDDEVEIKAAVAVNGPFPNADFATNPKKLVIKEKQFSNTCDADHTGTHCQHEVKEIDGQSIYVPVRTPVYRKITLPNDLGHSYNVIITVSQSHTAGLSQIWLSSMQVPKFGGHDIHFSKITGRETKLTIELSDHPELVPGTPIFITLYSAVGDKTMTLEHNLTPVPSKSPSSSPQAGIIPSASADSQSGESDNYLKVAGIPISVILFGIGSYFCLVLLIVVIWKFANRNPDVMEHRSDNEDDPAKAEERGELLTTSDMPL